MKRNESKNDIKLFLQYFKESLKIKTEQIEFNNTINP
jgi:hypothetical protein